MIKKKYVIEKKTKQKQNKNSVPISFAKVVITPGSPKFYGALPIEGR